MSREISMFKKMKERITDEVNSATNKLQNMQIIDQLTSTIGQQMIRNDMTPNQLLPEPLEQQSYNPNISQSSRNSSNNKFSLIDDCPPVAGFNEDDELNFEISPQHELFDEHSIRRLKSTNNGTSNNNIQTQSNQSEQSVEKNEFQSVINNINELNSDIEEDCRVLGQVLNYHDSKGGEDDLDVEIDLLSDKSIQHSTNNDCSTIDKSKLNQFKNKYRVVIRTLRKLNQDFINDKNQLEAQRNELNNKITALRSELESKHQQQNNSTNNQHDSLISVSTSVSENDKSSAGSPQPTTKTGQKLKDLEKLLAKCKESLKLKNKQIQSLRDSLSEVEKFKDANGELKKELAELREAHETWTLSIAENKRVMHQELEEKNLEMHQMKNETNGLQIKLNDSNNKIKQLKSAIQDLESRLVSTSAAHQKERESLTKELLIQKNNAIKQIQSEHEHNLERVKLDLEKTIEALKMDILKKDEQMFTNTKEQQQLKDKNQTLAKELEEYKQKLEIQVNDFESYKKEHDLYVENCNTLESELNKLKLLSTNNDQLESQNKELNEKVQALLEKLSIVEEEKIDIEQKLVNTVPPESENKVCDQCESYEKTIEMNTENFRQELHELNTQLTLLNTANEDQEKELVAIKSERDKINDSLKSLKVDFEELQIKNESLARVIRENETEMQNQQEQLDHLAVVESDLDNLKKENSNLSDNLTQLKSELEDKNTELNQLKAHVEELNNLLTKYKSDIEVANKTCEELKNEKDLLISSREKLVKKINEVNEQLVIRILSAIKNLETPNTSPGSDKSYSSNKQSSIKSSETNDSDNDKKSLPDPLTLMEELSSLAMDRSNSYMTATQRLQAVLLDNTMMGDEIKRLKDDLNNLNREKTFETQCSMDEVEKLQTENQSLIHDQQSYEDRIRCLEEEIDTISKYLHDKSGLLDVAQNENADILAKKELLEADCQSKEAELKRLKEEFDEKQKTEEVYKLKLDSDSSLIQNYEQNIKQLQDRLLQLESGSSESEEELSKINEKFNKLKEENIKLNEELTKIKRSGLDQNRDSNTGGVSVNDNSDNGRPMSDKETNVTQKEGEETNENAYPPENADHTYQIRALKRLLEQYQRENLKLKEIQKQSINSQSHNNNDSNNQNEIIPDSTQFEYLKNIVYQFMLGKEPLVLARVISAVFKFDKNQIDQICKVQEVVQSALKQGV